MPTISFKPKKITQKITAPLKDRASDVIMNRFGLTADGERKPLKKLARNTVLLENAFAKSKMWQLI